MSGDQGIMKVRRLEMPTQNVNLTAELEEFVKAQVASGRFNSASEVHRAAIAEMAREEEERTLRLERLRKAIQLGADDLDQGRYVELENEGALDKFIARAGERALARHGEVRGGGVS